jgi:hypothetical protein
VNQFLPSGVYRYGLSTARYRTRTTDKLKAWIRRLQAIIIWPHPYFDTFVKTLCKEWIFLKMNIRKHLAKMESFNVVKTNLHDRVNRIKRIVFNMAP